MIRAAFKNAASKAGIARRSGSDKGFAITPPCPTRLGPGHTDLVSTDGQPLS